MSETNRPAYVRNMRTRHGKPIRYLRMKGRNICRLPMLPYGSPEFRQAYEQARPTTAVNSSPSPSARAGPSPAPFRR
ncbi:MAG TPA: hypothetical protein VD906_05815 [Caulobacteraceae bacterium]|nr:hypothetical protein [Caulobacteraceae bacterium]